MTAIHQVADTLRAAGLRLEVAAGRVLMVAPRSQITGELRTLIRAHKAQLLDLLEAANDAEPDIGMADLDRWWWPHSTAMNAAEIATFAARVVRFKARGLGAPDAARLADRLVNHDRDEDGLRCCLECAHLNETGPHTWRWAAWRDAGIGAAAMGHDLATVPQRCPAFHESGPPERSTGRGRH